MELIRVGKAKYCREKDLKDIAFIDQHGIDEEKYKRVIACMENMSVSMSSYDELKRLKTQ